MTTDLTRGTWRARAFDDAGRYRTTMIRVAYPGPFIPADVAREAARIELARRNNGGSWHIYELSELAESPYTRHHHHG